MNKHIAHINDITPRRLGMFLTDFLCQHIGCFTNNHDVVNHRMIAHHIAPHFLKSLPFKEIHHMTDACLNVNQPLNIPNLLSHRPVSCHD